MSRSTACASSNSAFTTMGISRVLTSWAPLRTVAVSVAVASGCPCAGRVILPVTATLRALATAGGV